MGSWYWGRTTLGPYTIIWFDGIDINGTEHSSGYVSRNGKILTVSCGTTTARPTGVNSQYPPVTGQDPPQAFHVEIDAGSVGTFVVDTTVKNTLTNLPGIYQRWVGTSRGGLEGEEMFESSAFFEQFTLAK